MEESFAFGSENEATGAHQRGEVRDSMFLQAGVRRVESGREANLRVRNLSSGGLMADANETYVRGEAVEVELRGIGQVPGRIAWVREDRIGIAFDLAIDPKLARKPVGTKAVDRKLNLVPPIAAAPRRPGLRRE